MTSLANHQSNDYVKLLALGDAKTGKTGALVSLVEAGFKLRILDHDNLLDVLKGYVLKRCPDKIGNVEFRSLRDKRKSTAAGPIIDGQAKAFVDTMNMLDRWKYTDEEGTQVDLGPPAEWGPDCVLVLDSLSRFCDSAYDFRLPLTPKDKVGNPNTQATYGDAQDAVEASLAMMTSKRFETNVVVTAHVRYLDLTAGSMKGFPQTVGQKLSLIVPQYFPTIVQFENNGGKRRVRTISSPLIDLANPRPFAMKDYYDIENGYAEIFETLRAA